MAIKFLSGLNLSDVTAGSILKLDSNGKIVAAVDGTDYNTSTSQWSTAGQGGVNINKDVRIGTFSSDVLPEARLHVYEYQTTDPKILIEDGNTGDASMQFKISTQSYTMGIDNSDSDKFVLAASTALGTTNVLEISTAGAAAFQEGVLFNEDVTFANDVNFNASGYNFTISSDTTTRTTLAWRIDSVDSWAIETNADKDLTFKKNTLNTTGDFQIHSLTRITNSLTVNTNSYTNTITAGHSDALNLIDTKTLILDDSFGTNDGRVFGVLQPAPFKPSDIILSDSSVASAAVSNSVTNTFPNVKGEADATGITNDATFTFAEALAQAETLGGRLPTLEEVLNGVGNGSGQGYDAEYIWTQTKAGHGKYWVAKGHGINYNDAKVVDINDSTPPEYRMRIFYDISKDNMPVYYDNSSNIRATSIKAENSDGIALRALDGDIGITVTDDGDVKFNQYTAGLLKTDSVGNISLDTNTYLTSVSVDWSDIASINGTININSTTQIGEGDTETLVSFQNSGTERGSFQVDSSTNSYFVATGFKTSTASTGFLKADGTVDTNTYSTATGVANNADVTPSWVPSTDPAYATTDYVDTELTGLASESWANTNLVNVSGDTMTDRLRITKASEHVSQGSISASNAHLDLYNNWESNTDQKGSIITFTDNYYDGSNYNKTLRAAIKGGTDTVGNTADGYLEFYTDSAGANSPNLVLRLDKNKNASFTNNVDVNGSITSNTVYTEGSVINTSNALVLRSDVQHGQGDEDAVISFKQSTAELAKIDQGGYMYAAGFKVGSGSGVLRADGSTETITFGTMASASTGDYKTSDATETYVGQELASYTPTSSFGTAAFSASTDFVSVNGDTIGGNLDIVHASNATGLTVRVSGGASPTVPQFKVGRDVSQYFGVFTTDRDSYLIHRQDEGTGTCNMHFQMWSSSPDSKDFLWEDASNAGSGVTQRMKLTDNSELTLGGGSNTITNTKVGNWDTAYGWGNHASQDYATESFAAAEAQAVQDNLDVLSGSLGSAASSAATDFVAVSGDTMSGTLRLPWKWNSTDITANSFYVQRSATEDGFAFGIGTGVSTWFSWDGSVGTKRAIDVWNDGSKILLGDGGHNTEISNDLYVPSRIYHTNDTDTYMQFHAGDQWRVVTGGTERLEVNNTATTVANTLTASGGINGLTLANGGISGSNYNITGVNQLEIADPGEGIVFKSGSSGDMTLAIVDDSSDNILRFSGTNAIFDVAGSLTSTNLTIADGIYHEGDGNTSFTFGTDAINLNTGGGGKINITNSTTKVNNDLIVAGGETFSLGERAEADDNGRTVLIEGAANASNGEGAGRIFFTEHNSTDAAADKYGLSLYYEGDLNIALPSGFQPNTGNATWSLRRHDNSVNGVAIMSGSRTNNNVLFSGTVTVGGALNIPEYIYHNGDSNTYVRFTGDRIRIVAGGSTKFDSNNTYLLDVTPAAPSVTAANIVGETIEVVFEASTTAGIDYYQVWSSVNGGSFGMISQIPPDDFAATMTVVDASFDVTGDIDYRVYAVKSGIYSSPGTANVTFATPVLDVTNMSTVSLNTAYYIQYDMPASRFVDHVEIYMDAEAASGDLNRTGATLIYSGNNTSYMYQIGASDLDKFHQFWVEVIES